MRVLVTGADGFVGLHLCAFLRASGDEVVELAGFRAGGHGVDVRDAAAVHDAVADAHADGIIHLAGASSVAQSHRQPEETFAINAAGTLNVLTAMRTAAPSARLVCVGSGEVYGAQPEGERATEGSPLLPRSPYAASKAAAEIVAFQFHRSYGMHVVCARPFNHIGAGQAPHFFVPDMARQLDALHRSGRPGLLSVGNVDVVRDMSHVDDVVRAYRLLLTDGRPGEAYNVCSGEGHSLRALLQQMIALSGASADIVADPGRVRAAEIEVLVGDPQKLEALGWRRTRTVRDALGSVLDEAAQRADATARAVS